MARRAQPDDDQVDRDPEDRARVDRPGRDDAQAMGDQSPEDIRSSLPPGAGTKPADARGDVDRLQPYEEDVAPLRMSDVDVPPAALGPDAGSEPTDDARK